MLRDENSTPKRDFSEDRKGIYYLGNALAVIGILLFLSNFIFFFFKFGEEPFSSSFQENQKFGQYMMLRAFGGIILIGLGTFLSRLGKLGAAGSGLLLNPQRARQDLEPWSRMGGGMLKDTLDEAGISLGSRSGSHQEPEMSFDEKLRRLHKLYEDGIITKSEYDREKSEILDS